MITINKLLGTVLSLSFGFVSFMFISAKRRTVIYHEMSASPYSATTDKLAIFFISDIHRRKIDAKLIRKIQNDYEVDIVIIGGDLAEKGVPLKRIKSNVRHLASLGPVFFVWGNNDREVGENKIRKIITNNGGKVLDNESVVIPGHPCFCICGSDDPSSEKVDINSTLQYIEDYEFVIAVTHTPTLFQVVEQYCKPLLMLAGHTHGGQIRIGKFGLQDKGEFRLKEGRAKLISNGYGTSTLPLRLGAAPESHVIQINYGERVTEES